MDIPSRTRWLQSQATALGFTTAGSVPAVAPPGAERLSEWLAAGFAGEMNYLANRQEAYHHPSSVLNGVRSLLMLTLDYQTLAPQPCPAGYGRVSRYAWGERDYHDLIHGRLRQLTREILQQFPEAQVRGVVDTAPLLERDFAQLAGLGWIGKHTLLLNRSQGSWFFLAAVLTDLELEYDATPATDHCGSCTACLDVCPTEAFPQPHLLDASRCISYLTIEHREAIPHDLRSGIGDWLFGCDLCQEACPWNRRATTSLEPTLRPRPTTNPLELVPLFFLSQEQFRERFRRTPLWRSKRRGILRNAAIVLGNHPAPEAVPALRHALQDEEALVRGAVAWALGHYAVTQARPILEARLALETEAEVRAEILAALQQLQPTASVDQVAPLPPN